MPDDATTRPGAPPKPSGREFLLSAALGFGIPLVSAAFGGVGGTAGFAAAVVVLWVAAIAARPSVDRFFGVATGVALGFVAIFVLVALALRDL